MLLAVQPSGQLTKVEVRILEELNRDGPWLVLAIRRPVVSARGVHSTRARANVLRLLMVR